jgi:hypothetical protein
MYGARALSLLATLGAAPLTEALEHLIGILLVGVREGVIERIERRDSQALIPGAVGSDSRRRGFGGAGLSPPGNLAEASRFPTG